MERMIRDVVVPYRGEDEMAMCHAEEKTKLLQSRNSLTSFILSASWFTHITYMLQSPPHGDQAEIYQQKWMGIESFHGEQEEVAEEMVTWAEELQV
ncbi:hypothetical protein ACFX2I_045945 [Malus domestica]